MSMRDIGFKSKGSAGIMLNLLCCFVACFWTCLFALASDGIAALRVNNFPIRITGVLSLYVSEGTSAIAWNSDFSFCITRMEGGRWFAQISDTNTNKSGLNYEIQCDGIQTICTRVPVRTIFKTKTITSRLTGKTIQPALVKNHVYIYPGTLPVPDSSQMGPLYTTYFSDMYILSMREGKLKPMWFSSIEIFARTNYHWNATYRMDKSKVVDEIKYFSDGTVFSYKNERRKYLAPFDQGFLNGCYTAILTNYNNMRLPLSFVYELYSPQLKASTSNELKTITRWVGTTLSVEEVPDTDILKDSRKESVYVQDYRPVRLAHPITYIAGTNYNMTETNTTYYKAMVAMADKARKTPVRIESKVDKQSLVRLFVVLGIIIQSIVLVILYVVKRGK